MEVFFYYKNFSTKITKISVKYLEQEKWFFTSLYISRLAKCEVNWVKIEQITRLEKKAFQKDSTQVYSKRVNIYWWWENTDLPKIGEFYIAAIGKKNIGTFYVPMHNVTL